MNAILFSIIVFGTIGSIPARIRCNEKMMTVESSSVCHGKPGITQAIHFKEVVEDFNNQNCHQAKTKNGRDWMIITSHDRCVYHFRSHSGKYHQFTIVGYKE